MAFTSQLPRYMVPTGIEVLDRLPLNSNGKADRSLLANRVVPPLFGSARVDGDKGIGGSGGLSEIPTIKEPKTPEETLMVERGALY